MRVGLSIISLVIGIFLLFGTAAGFKGYPDQPAKIIAQSSFIDSKDRLNVVGTVRNIGKLPIQVTIGLNVEDGNGSHTIQNLTYGRIIWPLNDSPFKFVVESGSAGRPYILNAKELQVSNYLMLILNYSSMAVGKEKAFVATIKNTAPFEVHNVSVFASVRSDNATQLDTVRSNVIPVLKSGEEQTFTALPDASVKSKVYYYSCAGVDLDDPITTIDAGNGQIIPYDIRSIAQISSLRYENMTDSFAFDIRPYMPGGGPLNLKLPQLYQNQMLTVMLDGKPYGNASVKGDGKTMSVDMFIPDGDHKIEIQGVRNVPEFPFAAIVLAAITTGFIMTTRLKAAFKVE
jgi:hypothetical protein